MFFFTIIFKRDKGINISGRLTTAGRIGGVMPGGRGLRVALTLAQETAAAGEGATRGLMTAPVETVVRVEAEDETEERTLAVSIF